MAVEATIEKPKKSSMWGGGKSPYNVSWGKMYMWFFLVSDAFTFSSLIIAYGTMRHRFSEIWPKANDVFTHFPFVEGHIPLAYVGLMTFILIMSSVTMVLAVDAGARRDNKAVRNWMILTIIGGFMFLGSQAWEWYHFIKGTDHGAYVMADGNMARYAIDSKTHHVDLNTLILPDGNKVTGSEAEAIKNSATLFQGANMTRNEYGHPLFANFFFFITGFHGFHVFSGVMINIIILINVMNGVYLRRGHYEQVEKSGLYWHFVDLVWVFVFTFFYLV
jgi:cytochrome c oxidase subunit III